MSKIVIAFDAFVIAGILAFTFLVWEPYVAPIIRTIQLVRP